MMAVDIDIADACPLDDVIDAATNPTVNSQGQPIAKPIDFLDGVVQFAGLESNDVQYRSKHFALDV